MVLNSAGKNHMAVPGVDERITLRDEKYKQDRTFLALTFRLLLR